MESLETIRNRVKIMLNDFGEEVDIVNDDGEGLVLNSTIISNVVGGLEDEFNIEIKTIYPNLYADTNVGTVNLCENVADEYDWIAIENEVMDFIDIWRR